jgi:hypothetical protein
VERLSLLDRVRAIEREVQQVRAQLAQRDDVSREMQRLLGELKLTLGEARLAVRDYEYAETRAEQLRLVIEVRNQMAKVQAGILQASKYNLLSAVEVAQLSANAEYIADKVD